MPRYCFQCEVCENKQVMFLRMSETLEDCVECGSSNCMNKVYDKFFYETKTTKQHKVGNITKEYIEKNREILKQQKEEALSTDYEPA